MESREEIKASRVESRVRCHLDAGAFITKFRKIFLRNEMNDDLVLVPARLVQNPDDRSTKSCCRCRRREQS